MLSDKNLTIFFLSERSLRVDSELNDKNACEWVFFIYPKTF